MSLPFAGESHTLGNALKNVILQNPSVTFCGYSIPHPAEDQMFLRIQTAEGGAETASDVLKRGFVDLKKMCAITRKKFNKEREEFQVCLLSSAFEFDQFRRKLCMYRVNHPNGKNFPLTLF